MSGKKEINLVEDILDKDKQFNAETKEEILYFYYFLIFILLTSTCTTNNKQVGVLEYDH
jgi:hypothetical protein